MIQRGQHLGFALETGEILGVAGQRGGQDFDCDIAAQLRIARAIDLLMPPERSCATISNTPSPVSGASVSRLTDSS